MLAKRIIPCLDVKDGCVVKGIKFKNHEKVGDILSLAKFYSDSGADELVFYDITASCEERAVDCSWISRIAEVINIPFCVAGGIKTLQQAERILHAGADKLSINTPALENPQLISDFAKNFGTQCVVIGVDSSLIDGQYCVLSYTGSEQKMVKTDYLTFEWLQKVQELGAGEVVLNCLDSDGTKKGYDIQQIIYLQSHMTIPFIASGGAGSSQDFLDLFLNSQASGALAASIFHRQTITIPQLKDFLSDNKIEIRHVRN